MFQYIVPIYVIRGSDHFKRILLTQYHQNSQLNYFERI